MIHVEPIIIAQDRHGPVWDIFVRNDQGKELRAYYGVVRYVLDNVMSAVGHCNRVKDRRRQEALLQQELP